MTQRLLRTAFLIVSVVSCRAERQPMVPATNVLVTDSTEFVVRYQAPWYVGRITYRFTNPTNVTLSTHYCHTPPPPDLEKQIDGGWVSVYPEGILLCKTLPPFRISPGGSYRGARGVHTPGPNVGMDPRVQIDSINGVYRLRWSIGVGPDPDAPGIARLEVTSNTFRLIVRE